MNHHWVEGLITFGFGGDCIKIVVRMATDFFFFFFLDSSYWNSGCYGNIYVQGGHRHWKTGKMKKKNPCREKSGNLKNL